MIVSNLRGRTGAGTLIVKNRKVHGVKTLGSGIHLIEKDSFKEKVYDRLSPQIIIGHTRLPTKGGNTIENVHPHMKTNVSGVHNGTMHKVDGTYVGANESDSNLLYRAISEKGLRETLANSDGAYALVFIDYKKGTLNFIRNSQRPLYFAKEAWGSKAQTLYWASERSFLNLILSRNNVRHEIEELPTNSLWSLPIQIGDADFQKEAMYGGTYQVRSSATSSGGSSNVTSFLDRKNSQVSNSSSDVEGKGGTFVIRDGKVVRKGHVEKQVTLPRTESGTGAESQGVQANGSSGGEADRERVTSDEQREASSSEVFDRNGGEPTPGHRLPNELISREEREFNDDVTSLFQSDTTHDDTYRLKYGGIKEDNHLIETIPGGPCVTKTQLARIAKTGCAYCGESVNPEAAHMAWLDHTQFLCEPCVDSPEAMQVMHDFYPYSPIMEAYRKGSLAIRPPESWYDTDGTFTGSPANNYHILN